MNEDERLYLQFLQNNIAKMNSNSSQVKGWCITIVTALLAIFAAIKNPLFLIICLVPIIMFWFLDAKYLQQEHKFVEMYNSYIKDTESKPNTYEMPMNSYAKGLKGFFKALFSWAAGPVYGLIVIMVIGIWIFVK